jgi:hypothetical protein
MVVMMMSKHKVNNVCFACFLFGKLACWALLIFGGIVGGLPMLGFSPPSPMVEKTATYLMAFSLLLFAISYFLQRLAPRTAAH